MEVEFIWDDKYLIGNDDIDSQHKYLFELGNCLPEVASKEDVKPFILKLYNYTREHFSFEEQLMKSFNYALYEKHRELHEELIRELNFVSYNNFDSDNDIIEFKMFMYNWLINHVLNEDVKYAKVMREQNAGG